MKKATQNGKCKMANGKITNDKSPAYLATGNYSTLNRHPASGCMGKSGSFRVRSIMIVVLKRKRGKECKSVCDTATYDPNLPKRCLSVTMYRIVMLCHRVVIYYCQYVLSMSAMNMVRQIKSNVHWSIVYYPNPILPSSPSSLLLILCIRFLFINTYDYLLPDPRQRQKDANQSFSLATNDCISLPLPSILDQPPRAAKIKTISRGHNFIREK